MNLTIYLSGEIHSNWRHEIQQGIANQNLPIDILAPITDHAASDDVGTDILGSEVKPFWKDHKSAKINAMRIRAAIDRADIVVVKFGDKYRQWNAAFDAGYATAKGKSLITLHAPDLRHALKEVDAAAMATAETPAQVVEILKYVAIKE
ncbi:YtoQ family protein [Chloroflexi bacterium TSY]|nr:YtoQ family protein [Chloroflexi bacterium TSY]